MNDVATTEASPRRGGQFAIVTAIFFLWGFATCLNDILVPHLKQAFSLDYFQSTLVQFAFFSAYLVVSIPAGYIVKRLGYPRGMVVGLVLSMLGALLFEPASVVAIFPLFLGALAVLASGITILQVAANPYVAILGPKKTAPVRLNLAQALNSLGTTLAPFLGASLILGGVASTRAESLRSVRLPYVALALIFGVLAVVIVASKLPDIGAEESLADTEQSRDKTSIWQFRGLRLGVIAIFAYVGGEVAVGSFMVSYLSQDHFLGWTTTTAAQHLSYYWGGAMVGRFIGAYLLRSVRDVLMVRIHAIVVVVLLIIGIQQAGAVSAIAVIAIGLFNSILFPTIFTMSLRGLGRFTAEGSGLLCSAIIGGALIPPLQGWVADHVGVSRSLVIPLLAYAYIVLFTWLVGTEREASVASDPHRG